MDDHGATPETLPFGEGTITVVELLVPWVERQHGKLRGCLGDVSGAPAVHQARVACRRLRSVLGAYRAVTPADAGRVRRGLRDLGQTLGDLRDLDVIDGLLTMHAAVADEARAGWRAALAGDRERGLVRARQALADAPAGRTLALLQKLTDPSGWPGSEAQSARDLSEVCLSSELHRVLERASGPPSDPELLHEVRKAAKRLRYTAEVASRVLPAAGAVATEAERLQEVLGSNQDDVAAARWLARLADRTADVGLAEESRAAAVRLLAGSTTGTDPDRGEYEAALAPLVVRAGPDVTRRGPESSQAR